MRARSSFLLGVLALAACAHEPPDPGRGPSGLKVVVVGIDGASQDVVSEMLAAGRMPNLARFLEKGAGGQIYVDAILHNVTSPALWTTAVTGVGPQVHGITGFELPPIEGLDASSVEDAMRHRLEVPYLGGEPDPGEDDFILPTSRHRQKDALWNILSKQGYRSAIVGLWATWPAEPVLGAIVSDHVTYSRMKASRASDYETHEDNVHPSALAAAIQPLVLLPEAIEPALLRRFADYTDEEIETIRTSPYDGDFIEGGANKNQELKFTVQSDRSYAAIGLRLARDAAVDPALLLVYLEGIDVVEHHFWPYHVDQRGVSDGDRAKYGEVVRRYYEFTDELIAPYLAMASDDTVVLVHSDHGYMTTLVREPPHWHSPNAIVAAAGGPILPGAAPLQGALLDLTPNVLYLLGLERPDYMPGRVWTEWMRPEFVAEHPVD